MSRVAPGGLQLQAPGLLPKLRGAAKPAAMGQVLAIVYRAIASHLIGKAGLTRATGRRDPQLSRNFSTAIITPNPTTSMEPSRMVRVLDSSSMSLRTSPIS